MKVSEVGIEPTRHERHLVAWPKRRETIVDGRVVYSFPFSLARRIGAARGAWVRFPLTLIFFFLFRPVLPYSDYY